MTTFEQPEHADLDWVVHDILEGFDEKSMENIKRLESPEEIFKAGFFFGMSIRNHYGLWHDSNLAKWFKTNTGLHHADDMSMIIEYALWYKVNDQEFDYSPMIKKFEEHWADYGYTIDMQPIPGYKSQVIKYEVHPDGKVRKSEK